MNIARIHPIAWNHSKHASSWRCDSHCGFDVSASIEIICLVGHQVLRHPSDHETSSKRKQSLTKAHIQKCKEFTGWEDSELTCSTVDEPALAFLKWQGSWGITTVSLLRKFSYHIPLYLDWLRWQTRHSTLAAKPFETSEFHQQARNSYLLLWLVSAHIPRNAISELWLRWSYTALPSKFVLPSATTLSNICLSEYALAIDAIEKQLP